MGNNLIIENSDEYKGEALSAAIDTGAKLIIVDDTRLTRLAARADIWLQLRPGTDSVLALGALNVIVNEDLYDKEFVENYAHGCEPFVKRVNEYPVDKVSEVTWILEDKIRDAARMFATSKPAGIQCGVLPLNSRSIAQTMTVPLP